MGGTDEISNLVTLCDACHASHHPNLAGGLARRAFERWVFRLARWLDRNGSLVEGSGDFGPVLRLLGAQRFRSGQLSIVLAALAGKSILVVSPTGSGKTLCFQLPAMLRQGASLVVSPLKALMAEQVSDLLRKKIPATFINSDLGVEEKATRFSLLSLQAFKLLYVAPERFFVRGETERTHLKQTMPSFLIVDEAHCVDQWGQDFRPEYGRRREVREKLGSPPVLAFTATAGKEMQQRILASLGIPDARVFVRDVDRPNIAMLRWECRPDGSALEIASLLAMPQLDSQKAMIFVPTVRVGEQLREALLAAGQDIPFYHSRLASTWEREQLVKRFLGQSHPSLEPFIGVWSKAWPAWLVVGNALLPMLRLECRLESGIAWEWSRCVARARSTEPDGIKECSCENPELPSGAGLVVLQAVDLGERRPKLMLNELLGGVLMALVCTFAQPRPVIEPPSHPLFEIAEFSPQVCQTCPRFGGPDGIRLWIE
jgi:ATP-dependent DNA helicase RecQ